MKKQKRKTKGQASEIDRHVGVEIRKARQLRRWSQEYLADQLDLTFQQVQKYERGMNRVSCGRIYQLAQIFGMPVEFFFPHVPQTGVTKIAYDQLARIQQLEGTISGIVKVGKESLRNG